MKLGIIIEQHRKETTVQELIVRDLKTGKRKTLLPGDIVGIEEDTLIICEKSAREMDIDFPRHLDDKDRERLSGSGIDIDSCEPVFGYRLPCFAVTMKYGRDIFISEQELHRVLRALGEFAAIFDTPYFRDFLRRRGIY